MLVKWKQFAPHKEQLMKSEFETLNHCRATHIQKQTHKE